MQTDARRAAPSAAALSAAEAAARPRGRGSASQQPTACRPARPTRRSPGKPLLPSPPPPRGGLQTREAGEGRRAEPGPGWSGDGRRFLPGRQRRPTRPFSLPGRRRGEMAEAAPSAPRGNSSARAPTKRRASLTGSWTPSRSLRRQRLCAVGRQLGAPPYIAAARGGTAGSSRRVARRDRRRRAATAYPGLLRAPAASPAPRGSAPAAGTQRSAARAGEGGHGGHVGLRAPRKWRLGADAVSRGSSRWQLLQRGAACRQRSIPRRGRKDLFLVAVTFAQ